jgi:hypothetical protein
MTTQVLLSGRVLRVLVGGAIGSGMYGIGIKISLASNDSWPDLLIHSSYLRQPKAGRHLPTSLVRCLVSGEHPRLCGMEHDRRSVAMVRERPRNMSSGWLLCPRSQLCNPRYDR